MSGLMSSLHELTESIIDISVRHVIKYPLQSKTDEDKILLSKPREKQNLSTLLWKWCILRQANHKDERDQTHLWNLITLLEEITQVQAI